MKIMIMKEKMMNYLEISKIKTFLKEQLRLGTQRTLVKRMKIHKTNNKIKLFQIANRILNKN